LRILLAPDKFKGTLTAGEVCRHLRRGILEADPETEVVSRPLADGGEGTLDVLADCLKGPRFPIAAIGPRGGALRTEIARCPDGVIIIESAMICGLSLLAPGERDPMRTSTFGLGKVLREVLSDGTASIVVGLGGSATVDGGTGAARAFGYRLTDDRGAELQGSGSDLEKIESIRAPRADQLPARGRIRALCDVTNPLTGPEGAARAFAPQKGASGDAVGRLERGLERLASIIERDLGVVVDGLPCGGAAGGLGAGLHAFLGADLVPGAHEILSLTGLAEEIRKADLVVTGEGAVDGSTWRGKVAGEVIRESVKSGKKIALVCGRLAGEVPWPTVQLIESKMVIDGDCLARIGRGLR